ncbi:flavonol 3-O-glucosyltransferase UGT89B1-like [Elaeis guineensis]|uniref:flavonol 3-O-glucosyltransferase UGT89B1-like n=1 Tax=Elaeis guineensis var. tenera TaxID=51953 RepID=UPI003C6D6638
MFHCEDGDGPIALTILSDLSSSQIFPFKHLPSIWGWLRAGGPNWESLQEGFLTNTTGSWDAVINTFDAFEGHFFAHLKHGNYCIWAVGPISPASHMVGHYGQRSISVEEVAAWLDACPLWSVVYICFGSQYTPTEKQGR